jgi:hypothetical protein
MIICTSVISSSGMCSVIMASVLVDYVFGLVSLISQIIQYETVCAKSNISLCEVGFTVEHLPKVFLLISETALYECVCVCVCVCARARMLVCVCACACVHACVCFKIEFTEQGCANI